MDKINKVTDEKQIKTFLKKNKNLKRNFSVITEALEKYFEKEQVLLLLSKRDIEEIGTQDRLIIVLATEDKENTNEALLKFYEDFWKFYEDKHYPIDYVVKEVKYG